MDTTNKTSSVSRLLQALAIGLCLAFSSGLLAANYYAGVFEFQKKLANSGNPQAQYKLAYMYENGNGVKKDVNQAKQWYEKSAKNKYNMAQIRLTYLDITKGKAKQKRKPWLSELNQEAKKGEAEALFLLGEIHEKGVVVKKNLKLAKNYFKKAAYKGNVDAETRLFAIDSEINRKKDKQRSDALAAKKAQQNADLQKAEAARLTKEKQIQEKKMRERNARDKQLRASNAQKASQLKLEKEQKRLSAENNRLDAEKKKIEAQQRTLAQQAAEEQANETDDEVEEVKEDAFESDLCSGRAARFRTQCN